MSSYDYRHLAADLAAGLKVTTGAFQADYQRAMTITLGAAPKNRTVQMLRVAKIGIRSMTADGNQARVLIFGQQSVTNVSTSPGSPRLDILNLTATMTCTAGQWLISRVDLSGGGNNVTVIDSPPGTPDLASAVSAGSSELLNILTLSRAHFDVDYQRSIEGATGTLRSDLVTKSSTSHQALTKGGFDLQGQIQGNAVESADGATARLLIEAEIYRLSDGLQRTLTSTTRLEVTMIKVGSAWPASDLKNVGLS